MAGFHHLHLRSQDPRQAAKWYVDVLGAKAGAERDIRGALSCPVQFENVTVNISGMRPAETLAASSADAHFGLDHFALGTDDLARDLARVKKSTARIIEEITLPTGGKIAFVAGPDNVRIELMQL